MRLYEELMKLKEMDELVPVKGKAEVAVVDDDLNSKLLKKIDLIADALAHAFEKEGINLDASLIADDIRRDCGLMGDVISTDELDVEHNPFDAATKQMHDMGPIDTNHACQTLLMVSPHEFVQVFLNGLKRNRGLLPGGMDGRALPHRPEPRRIGEGKEKDYSYIDSLAKKFSEVTECKEELHEEDDDNISLESDKPQEIESQDVFVSEEDVPGTFEEQMDFLAADEDEAIAGYEKIIALVEDEHIKEQLKKILVEEKAHKKFLVAVKKDPTLEYSHEEEEVKEKEVEVELPADEVVIEPIEEEVLTEKITDIKGYYNSSKNKEKFKNAGLDEKRFMQVVAIDPTYTEGSNKAGTYFEWLLRLITTGTTNFREMMQAAHEYKDQLSAFEDLKRRKRLPENKRDIMQIKNLAELVNVVATRGEEEAPKEAGEEGEEGEKKSTGSMSDFKQDLKDFPALCQKLTWPDPVTGTYEDHMELVGENDKWEVWKVKSPLGAFIFDQWGDGAKWCVGGFGYKGEEGKRSATSYYPNYLRNGEGVYVCFQQKNKNTPRPYNKALITFNDKARYSVSQFNHSNNGSYYSGGYSSDTAAEFARFLSEENLLDVLKGTEFGNCESIKDVETAERLKKGEPYVYGGEKVKNQFKDAIKKVVFEEGYSRTIKLRRQDQQVELVGIPENAFRDCKNLEEVEVPIEIQAIGFHAFLNCDKAVIKTPRHRISCFPQDVEYLNGHMIYTDDPVKEEPKSEEKPEDK